MSSGQEVAANPDPEWERWPDYKHPVAERAHARMRRDGGGAAGEVGTRNRL